MDIPDFINETAADNDTVKQILMAYYTDLKDKNILKQILQLIPERGEKFLERLSLFQENHPTKDIGSFFLFVIKKEIEF